jgi:DNA polymerase-4
MALRSLAVDFNSFFASCEQQERPELRGKPVGIVPVLAETTCCIAASYAAKAKGVKVGTGIAEARALCPGIVIVPQRPALYIQYHRRLREVIESCIHITETKSIDEMECDLTATFAPREKALAVAREIKARVARQVGPCLTSSIGIAPNWLLAKLATDMQKPDGLTVLDDEDIPQKLLALEMTDFCGIGPSMDRRLRARGIDTVAKLYAASRDTLRGVWGGIEGERMHGRLRGDVIPLPRAETQTVGHSHVLPPMLRTEAKALAVLHRLLQKAAMRLRSIGHYAGGLVVTVGYRDGTRWGEEIRFNETQDTVALTAALNQLWQRRGGRSQGGRSLGDRSQEPGVRSQNAAVSKHGGRSVPVQVGVVLNRLLPMRGHTPDLFDHEQEAGRERLHHAVDTLNQTFGNGTVFYGGAFGVTDNAPMRIAFTRIPTPELEEIDAARERRVRGEVASSA